MTELPRRSSLVAEVAEILRRGMETGEWRDRLPGEFSLCERLKVSRTTIRSALAILKREGWVLVSQGRPMRIAARLPRARSRRSARVVGLLSVQPAHRLSSFSHFVIGELQESLHGAGYTLEVHADRRFAVHNPSRSLTQLMSDSRARCWALLPPTDACAQWFANHHVPCLIVGSCDWSSTFPSLDVDLFAASRHAVGLLRSHGHVRVALIVPEVKARGPSAIEEGFCRGLANPPNPAATKPLIRHVPDEVDAIKSALDSLFADVTRPTGLLVARPKHVLTVMTYLALIGIRVPRDVSVICLGHDPYLDNLTPSVAHYTFHWKSFARRASTMIGTLADTGSLPRWRNLVMPQFRPGETLRTAADQPVSPQYNPPRS